MVLPNGNTGVASLAQARTVIARIIAERQDRESLVSCIACDVGAEILEGIRNPGDDLNSVELSRTYSTSRTPVREALMLLEKEGLVEVPPRRRPRVMRLSIIEIREIYRVRAALLELIAGDVARKISHEDVLGLMHRVDEMTRAHDRGDLSGYVWANVEFHDRNTQLADNRTAKRIIDSLLLRTLPLRRLSLSQDGRLQESLADHVNLVRAYEKRDPYLAAALIHSNHMNALATLEGCLAGRGDPFPEDGEASALATAQLRAVSA
jgi:DNA-binding GntR family transcriptional regulator